MSAEPHNLLGRSARNAVSGALLVIGVIAMYRWVVAPHVAYLQAVQRLAPAVDRMAAEDERIRRSLGPDLRYLLSVRQERADVQEGLFTDAEFTVLIRNLPAVVEQTGCTVIVADFTDGSDPGPGHGADPDPALRIRHAGLTVRGTLDQIAALLEQLQTNRPRVWVDAFRMERVAARPGLRRDDPSGPAAAAEAERLSGSGPELFKCQLTMIMYTLAEPARAQPGEDRSPIP